MDRLIDRFTPALSPELFDKYSFFELYPFDGGGSFINREIIGTVNDAEYTSAVVEKGALDEFGGYKNIDFLKFNFWRTIERTSWINRMYFIAPMANHARKTGNKKIARDVIEIMLGFAARYAPPATQQATCDEHDEILRRRDEEYNALGPEFNAAVPYEWFDFQPASRIIHGLYAMYFLKDMDVVSDEEWQALEDFIYVHGRNIFWGEEYHIKLSPGNHQALRAMALMDACAFFKGTRDTGAWIPVAERMCDFHIRMDFLRDGMLNDLSPSYHFFESWITRDALKLADREGFKLSEEARAKAEKAFEICCALRQPDGFSTVVSDGYPLDMSIFIASLGKEEKKELELLMDEAQIAVKKDAAGTFLLFDCSPLLHRLSHFHGGKQSVSCFFKGEGFLMDPGCCSYDDEDFSEYFKQSSNHTSMLVDGRGDSVLQGLYTWLAAPVCQVTSWENGVISSTMTSDAPGWENVKWERKAALKNDSLVLTDTVTAPAEHEYTFCYALRSSVKCTLISDRKVLLTSGNVKVEASFEAPVEIVDGKEFRNFVKLPAQKLMVKFKGSSCKVKSVFQVI